MCPFHSEKTPSFIVDDQSKLYYCFGCGARGDLFQFISDNERLTFQESLQKLARIAGIELQRNDKDFNLKVYYNILDDIAICCTNKLEKSPISLEYLKSRQILNSSLKEFRIGYFAELEITKNLLSKKYNISLFKKLGLLNKNNKFYFNNRIIFPICDFSGRIVGFGARALFEYQYPKYLNSTESLLFKKKDLLYGYHLSINEARKKGEIIIVEGYIDVIMLYQKGIKNVVGLLGTAVTKENLLHLWKSVPKIIICMDADDAGQNSSIKTAKLALSVINNSNTIQFIKLPLGKDPSDICISYNDDEILSIFNKSCNLSEFIFEYELKKLNNNDQSFNISPEQCYQLRNNLLKYVQLISNTQISVYYKKFFFDEVYKLQNSNYFKRIKFKKDISYIEMEELKNVSSKDVQQEYEEFIVVYCVIRFPELLDDYKFFELFSTFHVEIDSNMKILQQNIVNIKIQYPDSFASEFLLNKLKEIGFHDILDNIFRNKKITIINSMNKDIYFVSKSLEKIILLQQLKYLDKEIEALRNVGDHDIADQLSAQEVNLRNQINKLWK